MLSYHVATGNSIRNESDERTIGQRSPPQRSEAPSHL